jgi:hypothetical protein
MSPLFKYVIIMAMYEKAPEMVPCGLVARENSKTKKNTPVLTRAVRNSVKQAVLTHNQKTLELAGAQRSKPLKGGDSVACARQEIHTTGQSRLKVKKLPEVRRWHNAKKKTTTEYKDKIKQRYERSERVDFGYEGWFDTTFTHVVSADKEAFESVVVTTLSHLRDSINSNKSLLEMALGVNAEQFFKYLFAAVCVVVAGVFAYCSCTTGSWLAAILAGLSGLAGLYCLKEDMFQYARTLALEYAQEKYGWTDNVPEEPTKEELDAMIADFMKEPEIKHESGNWLFRAGSSIFGEILQAILVGGVGVAVCGKNKSFVEAVSRIPNVASGISTLIDMLLKWIATMCDEIFGTNAKDYFSANKELDNWAKVVMDTAQQFDDGKLKPDPTSSTYVCSLMQTGRQMLVDKLVTTPAGMQLFRACQRELERLQLSFAKQGLGSETKPEAYGVLLLGESGVGKSLTTQWLMKMIGVRTMSKERREAFMQDFHSEVYACCPEEEHWNGYSNQYFTVIDDLGQQVPAPGAPTEGIKVIRMINSNTMKLNMAALHEKGKVSFGSEWVFGSTNKYAFWDLNIVQPEAFLRRWNCIAIMAPRKEYCTEKTRDGFLRDRRLDMTKVGHKFNDEVAEFHIQRIADPQQQTFQTVEILSFRELEDKLVADYKARRAGHEEMLISVNAEMRKRLEEVESEECAIKHEGRIGDALAYTRKIVSSGYEKLCALLPSTPTTRMRKLYSAFKGSVASGYASLVGLRMSRAHCMIAISVLALVLVAVIPPAVKNIKGMMEKMNIPGFNKGKEVVFEDFDKFMKFCLEDQQAFLRKNIIAITEPTPDGVKRMRAVVDSHVRKYGYSRYERVHTDKRVGIYKGRVYESNIFARPLAYSEFGTKYVNGIFQRSVYHMFSSRQDKEKDSSGGTVLMVKGAMMLINKHFIDQMRASVHNGTSPKDTVHFVPHGRPDKVVEIPLSHLIDPSNISGGYDGEDAVIVNCSPYMEAHRDIVNKFVSNSQVERMRDHCFSVYTPDNPRSMRQHDVVGHFAPTVNIGPNVHKGMFWYNAPTVDGDCGGLLIETEDRDSQSRIVGIHAAGEQIQSASKMAFAQKISRETIQEWLSKWDDIVVARVTETLDFESSTFMGLNVVRTDTKSNVVMTKNPLVPSYMHGWAGPPTRVPAVLHPYTNSQGVKQHPLANALLKESSNNIPIDVQDVAAAVLSVTRAVMPVMRNRGRILTNEESVLGFQALPALRRNTSAGYYGLHNPTVGPCKHGALGRDGDYTMDTPEVQKLFSDMDAAWEDMKKGIPMDSPHLVFLKPEKRSLEKVENGNVRCVKASSMDEAAMIRKVFGALVSDLTSAPIVAGPCIGMNPLGGDWDFLQKHITARGPDVFAGDFKGFDQSQSGQLLRAVMDILINLAGHEDPDVKMVEKCITESLAAPRCMIGNLVYQNDHGLPSGNPLTSIMNSLFVMLVFRLAWLTIMRESDETRMACLKRFDESVTLVVYGDDHVVNASTEVLQRFNQHSLMEAFPKIGLTYTSDDKDDKEPPKYRKLSEVTFLKRSFRFEPRLGKYVAPLDLQTLQEVCYYTNKQGSREQITRDNVERTFRELALHGQEVYDVVGELLEKEHNKRAPMPTVRPPFSVALEEVYGQLPLFLPAQC